MSIGTPHFFDEIYSSLRNDSKVSIYFFQKETETWKTLYAPEFLLRKSSERLEDILKTAKQGEDGLVELKFFNADYEAWQVFLYWSVQRQIPPAMWQNQELLVRCWSLGEHLMLLEFMSDAILHLMRLYDRDGVELSAQVITIAFCAPRTSTLRGSKLRLLIAEEIVKGAIRTDRSISEHLQHLGVGECSRDHQGQLCGLDDITPSTNQVDENFFAKQYLKRSRFTNGRTGSAARWMDFVEGVKWGELRQLVDLRVKAAVAEERARHSS